MKLKIFLLIIAVAFLSSRAFGEETLTFAQFMPGDGNLFENQITMEELQKMPSGGSRPTLLDKLTIECW
jgi:hypothetical protein